MDADEVSAVDAPQVWVIEVQICGVWDTFGNEYSEADAITLASSIALPDYRVRISTPDHKIL